MLGECVVEGEPVGVDEGEPVGVDEGEPVGVDEGAPVGVDEGAPVGVDEGAPVGVDEGAPVGVDEGEVGTVDSVWFVALMARPTVAIGLFKAFSTNNPAPTESCGIALFFRFVRSTSGIHTRRYTPSMLSSTSRLRIFWASLAHSDARGPSQFLSIMLTINAYFPVALS